MFHSIRPEMARTAGRDAPARTPTLGSSDCVGISQSHSMSSSARLLAAGRRQGFQTTIGRSDFSVRANAKSCSLWHNTDATILPADVRHWAARGRLGRLVTLVRSKLNRCPTGKSPRTCAALSSPCSKNISLNPSGKSALPACPSHPTRGALRTSRHARWDAVDAEFAKDERKRSRTAKSCGPGAPTLALSSRRRLKRLASDGGKKARSPGRARSKP
jgi:hypothetical protein